MFACTVKDGYCEWSQIPDELEPLTLLPILLCFHDQVYFCETMQMFGKPAELEKFMDVLMPQMWFDTKVVNGRPEHKPNAAWLYVTKDLAKYLIENVDRWVAHASWIPRIKYEAHKRLG